MGDIEQLKELVQQQTRDAVAAQRKVDELIAALALQRQAPIQAAPVHGPVPDAEAVAAAARADKVSKLGIALRKSYKVKEFKEAREESVKEWLTRFDQEITTLKKMSGVPDDLTREEMVELFKDKLDYAVVKRLDTAFAAKDPVWTWGAVTYAQLQAIMKEEYGSKIAEVSEVLLQFGPSRLKKASEMSVAKFTHLWQEQLPECMTPGNADECVKFADLMKRALYYYCLDDQYIQKEFCELEEADSTFKKYFDQACIAEQKRK